MSRLNEGLYSSKDQGWMTPPNILEAILEIEGRQYFDMDVCCSEFRVPALRYATPTGVWRRYHDDFYNDWPEPILVDARLDGLTADWGGKCFMNPPYGAMIEKFIKKAHEERVAARASVWMLLPARTDTRYFQRYILGQRGFCVFLKGRIKFIPPDDLALESVLKYIVMSFFRVLCFAKTKPVPSSNAPFPAVLVYQGVDYLEKYNQWRKRRPFPGEALLTFGPEI